MRANPVIRPGFHPMSIGLMIVGFVIAWPLGLAMLAYMLWGDRMRAFADGVRDGYDRSRFAADLRRGFGGAASGFAGTCLIAYMSSLTGEGFTATQYAMFSSFYALLGKLVASQSGRIVEASARAAEGNGPLSSLKSLFGSMTPESLVSGAQKANVSPAALGAGCFTFFLYSSLIGVAAVVLTFMVVRRQAPKASEA